jgi:hypothetical protein
VAVVVQLVIGVEKNLQGATVANRTKAVRAVRHAKAVRAAKAVRVADK